MANNFQIKIFNSGSQGPAGHLEYKHGLLHLCNAVWAKFCYKHTGILLGGCHLLFGKFLLNFLISIAQWLGGGNQLRKLLF